MATHWGKWVKGRAAFVGFRRQLSLAEAIGYTPEYVSGLLKRSESPRLMLKGADAALCRALRTDAFTLFTDYPNVAPEAAPVQGHPRKPTREQIAA